ncbi:Gag-Pol polyprotein [Gossypium australe]|uniref:Gag-Pol polyprotein n=1 Tax=Gossypium australe TaxID=47621 RepID=A0A5B6X0J3_9ROSI|nr:Gag-Pol polyprotein [Gossypium australe]
MRSVLRLCDEVVLACRGRVKDTGQKHGLVFGRVKTPVDRACKAEELVKEKRKAESESRDSKKRHLGKSFQSSSKKSREFTARSTTSAGFSNRSKGRQCPGSKAQTTSIASVGNAQPSIPECP